MEDKKIIEVRWHGRGGQGAVVASKILAHAAILDGFKGVQSIPFFGMERRGAPVLSFTRISQHEIRIRHQIYEPDVVIILDPSLSKTPNIIEGLKPTGYVILNTKLKPSEILWARKHKVATVNAFNVSRMLNLKVAGFFVVNAPMLGAFAKTTNFVSINSIKRAIIDHFGVKLGEINAKAAEIAYKETLVGEEIK